MAQVNEQPITILRLRQVVTRTGISRSAIYEKLNPNSKYHDPLFAKPIKLGASTIGFIENDVNTWLNSRVESSRNAAKN